MSTGVKTNGQEITKGNRFRTPSKTPQVRIPTAPPTERHGNSGYDQALEKATRSFLAKHPDCSAEEFVRMSTDDPLYLKWERFCRKNNVNIGGRF